MKSLVRVLIAVLLAQSVYGQFELSIRVGDTSMLYLEGRKIILPDSYYPLKLNYFIGPFSLVPIPDNSMAYRYSNDYFNNVHLSRYGLDYSQTNSYYPIVPTYPLTASDPIGALFEMSLYGLLDYIGKREDRKKK